MIVGDLSTAASIAPQTMSIGVQFSTWWIGSSTWMIQGCERIERGDGTRGPHHPHGQPTDRRDTYLVHPTRTCAVKKPQETPRDPEHRTTKALREIGVEYVVQGRWQGRQELPREARAAIKQTAGTRVSTRTLAPGLF